MSHRTAIYAAFSLIPVASSVVALFFLTRLALRADPRAGDLARTGMIVVALGGVASIAWRFSDVFVDGDLTVLHRTPRGLIAAGLLFVAVGFVGSTGVDRLAHAAQVMSRVAVALLVLAVAFGFSQTGNTVLELLLATVGLVAAVLVLVQAARIARERGWSRVARTFAAVAAVIPPGIVLAEFDEQGLAWASLVLLTLGTVAFARAAWQLQVRYVRTHAG